MRQAAQQLREEQGPVKPEVRSGLARLPEAVAQQQGDASVYVWDGAGAVANEVLAEALDKAIVAAHRRDRETRERTDADGLTI